MDIGEKAVTLPFTGDLGGLIKVFADDRHWSGDGRDELEEEEEKKRKLAEERKRKLKEDCIEHIANVTAAVLSSFFSFKGVYFLDVVQMTKQP